MGTFFNGVQAACAVIALWFGYAAYTSWSSQEAAKRNADFAMEVLKAGYAAEKCFEGGRISTMFKNYDRREILKIASEGEAKLAECSPQFSQFAAFAFIAERALDKETSDAINAYVGWFGKNSQHFGMLKSFAGRQGITRWLGRREKRRERRRFSFAEPLHGGVIAKALTPARREYMRLATESSARLKKRWIGLRDRRLAKKLMDSTELADEVCGAFYGLEMMAPMFDGIKGGVEISGQVRRHLLLVGGLPNGVGKGFPNEFQMRVMNPEARVRRPREGGCGCIASEHSRDEEVRQIHSPSGFRNTWRVR